MSHELERNDQIKGELPLIVELAFGFAGEKLAPLRRKIQPPRFFVVIDNGLSALYRATKGFRLAKRTNCLSLDLEGYENCDEIWKSVDAFNGVSVEYDSFDLPIGVSAKPAAPIMNSLGSLNVFFKTGAEKAEYLPQYAVLTDKNGGNNDTDESKKLAKYGSFEFKQTDRLPNHKQ